MPTKKKVTAPEVVQAEQVQETLVETIAAQLTQEGGHINFVKTPEVTSKGEYLMGTKTQVVRF